MIEVNHNNNSQDGSVPSSLNNSVDLEADREGGSDPVINAQIGESGRLLNTHQSIDSHNMTHHGNSMFDSEHDQSIRLTNVSAVNFSEPVIQQERAKLESTLTIKES